MLDGVLEDLLTAAFPEVAGAATRYSWHSFRIGLACALHTAGCSDGHIQLICRWASPESLKIYRRVGCTENAFWCDKAEQAVVDSTQLTSVPKIDAAEGLAAVSITYGHGECARHVPSRVPGEVAPPPPALARERKRAQAAQRREAEHESDTASSSSDEAPEHAEPLDADNAKGAKLVCPSRLWPELPCNEHGGAGWTCRVRSLPARTVARIQFTRARDVRGVPYEDAYVQLAELLTWRRC